MTMMRKRNISRTGYVALGAAVLLSSMIRPCPVFADQAPDLLGTLAVQEGEGVAAETAGTDCTDSTGLGFTADLDGVSGDDRKFKTTITFE